MSTAILVIDVQAAFFEGDTRPFDAEGTTEQINKATNWARENTFPVIFIQHEQGGTTVEFDSAGWQLYSGLKVASGDYRMRKTTPDSFLRTPLQELLNELGITHLIICGYATEFCVDTTTRRAAGLGYHITLLADAHTTDDKPHASGKSIRQHHNCTLPSISSFGVPISARQTDDVIHSNP